MPLAKDLLHPSPEEEKRKHKKKRLVQSPNSYFMDVKCPGKKMACCDGESTGLQQLEEVVAVVSYP
uniref:Ribosomal protein S27 n=1 Tax=Microcebus murinus TaxID=30608 RepID=A0A8C5V9W9_MICMU